MDERLIRACVEVERNVRGKNGRERVGAGARAGRAECARIRSGARGSARGREHTLRCRISRARSSRDAPGAMTPSCPSEVSTPGKRCRSIHRSMASSGAPPPRSMARRAKMTLSCSARSICAARNLARRGAPDVGASFSFVGASLRLARPRANTARMSRAAFASDTRNASSSLEGTATADAKGGTEGGASGGADGAASGGASTVTISRALEHCGTRHLPPQQQRLARAAPVNSRHPARIERIVHFLQFHT